MAFKFNPLTGEFDLVNSASISGAASAITFDPTPTPEMVSTNVQSAIEETDQGFSYNRIRSGKRVIIRADRTMITFRSIRLDHNSTLVVHGSLVII